MRRPTHLHFIGIAGYAIRGIALAAQNLGYKVTGTDEKAYPPGSTWLDEHHLAWFKDPSADHLAGVDQVIINPQNNVDHLEIASALEQDIPVISWAELLEELTNKSTRIVVAGTHGKSTTTSLLAHIFEAAGKNPDFLIGAQPINFSSTVILTGSNVTIIEGDEYIASKLVPRSKFLYYHPHTLVVTAIEMDHPDVFTTFDDVKEAFSLLFHQLPSHATLISWQGCDVRNMVERRDIKHETYGLANGDWTTKDCAFTPHGLEFTVVWQGRDQARLEVPLFGEHNILNTLAACAVATHHGIDWPTILSATSTFAGVVQRFQRLSDDHARVTVISDYAHHPTEVSATLAAASKHFTQRRIISVFQPHTYSRTKELLKEYGRAFTAADKVFLTEIEGAREEHLAHTVSSQDIAQLLPPATRVIADRKQMADTLVSSARPGDVILVMTVGGFQGLAAEVAQRTALHDSV
jgi:UDP-N-acetylmuramate--L-alanine ligase